MRTRFPNLELRLQEGRTGGLLRMLLSGEIDVVLLALPAAAEGVEAEVLFFEPFRAVVPARSALANAPRLTVRDLADGNLLLLEEGHCLRDQAIALCGTARTAPRGRYASSLEMLRYMIAAGEGHSLLPQLAAQERAELDGLVRIRDLDGPPVGRTIGLGWRGTDPREAAYLRIAHFLREIAPAGTVARPTDRDGSPERHH